MCSERAGGLAWTDLFPLPDQYSSAMQPGKEGVQLPRRDCHLHQLVAEAGLGRVGKETLAEAAPLRLSSLRQQWVRLLRWVGPHPARHAEGSLHADIRPSTAVRRAAAITVSGKRGQAQSAGVSFSA
jgi:hypothetical protein